jgi:hypothetical protein
LVGLGFLASDIFNPSVSSVGTARPAVIVIAAWAHHDVAPRAVVSFLLCHRQCGARLQRHRVMFFTSIIGTVKYKPQRLTTAASVSKTSGGLN